MQRPSLPAEPPPLISAPAQVRTSAGVPIAVPVTITNRSSEARVFLVSPAGVDAAWLPLPSQSVAVPSGDSIQAELTLRPAEGTVPARYPVAIAVQALDPATGQLHAPTAVHEIDLVVSAPGQITISLDPPDSRAVHTRKLFVVLQNSGTVPETVHLEARSPQSTAVDLTRAPIVVPPASTVRVPARLTVSRPTLFRRPVRHTFSVTARTSAAPRYTEGSLTAKSLIGPTGAKIVAAIVVVALWVALALIFVPKLADKVRKPTDQAGSAAATQTVPPKAGKHRGGKGAKTGGGGKSPSGGGSGAGGSGAGGGAQSGGGASPAAANASGTPKRVQINGTVSGTTPDGVRVSIFPTTFGSSDATGGSGAATQSADTGPIGKLTPDAVEHTSLSPTPDQSGPAGPDGSFAFAVKKIGFYILQIAKPGYQTQRFVIDPTSDAVTQPMKVVLVSGTGSLHGVVHDASGGNVGAATITITDGTNTVTTSSVSTGHGIGTWSVDGLSTPSSYLVSASHDGLGVTSRLVKLGAGASAPVDLTMSSGVATLTGVVRAMIDNHNTRLGGITVTATDGTVTRTSTTVTTGSQTGLFTLPQLTLGKWTVTVSGPGYQLQTQQIKVSAGQKTLQQDVELSSSTVSVDGAVTGLHGTGLEGAGLTLTDATNTYKQTSLSGGRFSFGDVTPGTYTLTAEYAGYTSQTQTVKATLDQPVKHAHFALKLFHVTHDSTIVGYAANAISSSSSFGCRKDSLGQPIGCNVYFQLFGPSGKRIPVTLDPKAPNVAIPSRSVRTIDGPVPYELSINTTTNKGAEPIDGLMPGQYKLVISSPGFIPATVRVQVPLNGVAAMPEISLFPANELAGRLKSTGDIDAQTIPSDPPVANCMLALPVGFNAINPSRFFCDQTQADTAATPTSPAYGPDDVTKYAHDCTFTGAAEPGVALTKNQGTYDLTGLCDGRYRLYPIIGNRAYVTPDLSNPIKQTFTNGQTIEYDPTIDRYPVVTATVHDLDVAGLPTPDKQTDVTLTCDAHVSTAHTDDNGVATFYGVPVGSPTCTIGDPDATSPIPAQFLEVNQTYATSVILVNRTMTLLGRIVSPYGASATNRVAGVPVTVRAITGYNGITPVWTSVQTTTNDHGCFATAKTPVQFDASALPADPAHPPVPGTGADTDCGLLTTANIAELGSVQPGVQVSTDRTGPTRALGETDINLTPVTILAGNTITPVSSVATQSVLPNPVPLNGLKFTADNGAGGTINLGTAAGQLSFANASFTVTPVAANGSGTITAGVTSTGQLTWADSNLTANDTVWPGTYSYTLAVHGFKGNQTATTPPDPLAGQLNCGYDTATDKLSCSLSAASLTALGNLTGTVSDVGGPVVGASVFLDACTGACVTSDPPTTSCPVTTASATYSTTTDPSGKYDFSVNGDRQLVPAGYRLIVCAAGRVTSVSEADIVSGTNTPIDVPMRMLGAVKGKLTGFNNVGLGSVPVTLTGYAATDTAHAHQVSLSTTTDGNGNFTFTDPDLGNNFLLPGDYTVAADPVGYQHATRTVTVALKDPGLANDNDGSLAATALGGFSGTVSNSFGTAVKNATVTLTCHAPSGTLACPSTSPTPATTNDNGRFTFIGGPDNVAFFLTPGTWQVRISAAGFADLLLDGSDTGAHNYQTINPGNNDNTSLVMSSLGALAGTVTDSVTGSGVPNAVVHASCVASSACNGAAAQTASTDGLGNYIFGTPGARDVFAYGTWTFTITGPAGYHDATPSTSLTFSSTNVNPADPGFQLRPLGTLSGTIVDSTNSALPVVSATVRATCTSGCGSPTPTVTPVQTDTSGNFAFGTAGARQVFADGTWVLTITGPAGYNNAAPTTTYTFGSGTGQQVYTAPSLTLRPRGSLSGRIVDSTDSSIPVVSATVRATCTSGCGSPTPTVDPVQTDSSGNFAFGTSGSRTVFADGTWTLTITGPTGYNNAAPTTTYTFGPGTEIQTAPSLTLRPKGSLSGNIVDSTNSALPVAGATLRATCTSGCGSPTPTVSPVATDSSGNFAFGSAGARNVFADGTWTVTITGPSGYNNAPSTTYTFGSGSGQQVYTDQDSTLRPLGALSGTVTDSTTSLAVTGAVVHATCTSGCGSPTPTVDPVATDGLGRFAFGVAGGRNVFADGTWTLSVTAPTGYKDSGPLTGHTVTFGPSSNTNQTADPIALLPFGSLTGTVFAVGAGTQRLSNVTVTADECSSATDTSCTGTEHTAVTGDTGVYAFGAILDPGRWKLSTSTTGYSSATSYVNVVAGVNNATSMAARTPAETPDLTLNYKPVDLPVKVVVTSTGLATKHAIVTFRRVDGGPVDGSGGHTSLTLGPSAATGTPPIYTGSNLVPTAYNVTVTGDSSAMGSSIQTTSVTVGVAPTDTGSAPELDINVALLDFAITGKAIGKIGDTGTTTTTAVTGARVVLLSSPPSGTSAGTVATDVNDNEIRTTTADSSAANPGSFTLPHVPNGTYYVSINQPDPDAPATTVPANGFAGSLIGPITVLNGIYALGTQSLDAVYHQLTVTVDHNTDDDLSGATPTLSLPSGSSLTWTDRQPDSSDLTTDTSQAVYTFNSVPAGCWTFALTGLSTAHKGTLAQTTPSGSCPSGSFPVSSVQNTDAVSAAFGINEHKLTIAPTINVNAGSDPGTSATFTATVRTQATAPATPVTVATVTGITHGAASTDVYLPPGRYTVTLSTTASTDFWTTASSWTASVNLTQSRTATVSATENALSSIHIAKYSSTALLAGDSLTVTATCTDSQDFPTGCGTAATAPTQSDTGTGVTFSGLAPGTWTFRITGTFQGTAITPKTLNLTLDPGANSTQSWP